MFSHIRTSKENKEVVTQLTNKFSLGTENVIAKIALVYSLTNNGKLDLKKIKDSGGKEYSKNVLLGENFELYIGMICVRYGLFKTDMNLSKYVKLHLDNGLEHFDNKLIFENGGIISLLEQLKIMNK